MVAAISLKRLDDDGKLVVKSLDGEQSFKVGDEHVSPGRLGPTRAYADAERSRRPCAVHVVGVVADVHLGAAFLQRDALGADLARAEHVGVVAADARDLAFACAHLQPAACLAERAHAM